MHSPIPEIEGDEGDRDSVSTALHTATAAVLAPAMPDANRNAADSEAWQAVLAQREAARLRSGTDVSLSGSDTSLGSPLSKHEEESSPISP